MNNTSHQMISIPDETVAYIPTPSMASVATAAVHTAFRQARAEGLPIVVAEGNELVELGPGSSRTVLKQLPPLQKPARRMLIIRK